MEPNVEYISQRQAILRYGVDARTLRRREQDGRLPSFVSPMDDRSTLYRVSDIERLMTPRPRPAHRGVEPVASS
jgi:hypothetical protein